jgi:hypothetical protein
VNYRTPNRGVLDAGERPRQRSAFNTGHKVSDTVYRKNVFVLRCRACHPRRSVEKELKWNIKNLGKMLQSARANAVSAFFVLLNLLERNPEALSESLLGEVPLNPK